MKPDFVVDRDKIDHAPVANKLIAFAHGQHARRMETLNDFLQAALFRAADEEDVAMRGFRQAVDDLNYDRMAVEGFPGERLIERFAERIITQNAENERRVAPDGLAVIRRLLDKALAK